MEQVIKHLSRSSPALISLPVQFSIRRLNRQERGRGSRTLRSQTDTLAAQQEKKRQPDLAVTTESQTPVNSIGGPPIFSFLCATKR